MLVNVESSDHAAYCIGFCYKCHYTYEGHNNFYKRSHNLTLKSLQKIMILGDITAVQEKHYFTEIDFTH